MEMERQQPSRTPEANRPRDKDHGTRSMGQVMAREDGNQETRRRTINVFLPRSRTGAGSEWRSWTMERTRWIWSA